ncbi:MAG TPA: 3-deoxy-manno-octulosonate cytidylyltransferase [Candidatus Tripitaka californicus]|uniref:3-deoxy-manno-octulosonate cytidylyltransferase n=1 Tax=Candidatus Tripitaka californicus TaxID=3367616 RepID=UPI0040253468|nr:3-deoxy-manno-octulosonate cytidylyltransferase [Planctomycetota bacterium]
MKAFVVIPARYGSSRLPGKLILPEAKTLTGKFLIEHVYSRVIEAKGVQGVLVATDDRRIFDVVKGFGGEVVMTSPEHKSGTDRVAEVAKKIDADIIVNVQGDEPEVHPEMVDTVVEAMQKDKEAVMATLANVIDSREEYQDPHVVKVVMDSRGYALYFSRSPIPYVASWGNEEGSNVQGSKGSREGAYYKHLGIYSYRRDFLLRYSQLPRSPLEEAEKLEQLRVLSNGYKIKVAVTPHRCCGVDTPEDFRRFLDKYRLLAVGSQKPESRKRITEGQVSR